MTNGIVRVSILKNIDQTFGKLYLIIWYGSVPCTYVKLQAMWIEWKYDIGFEKWNVGCKITGIVWRYHCYTPFDEG